MLYMGFLTIPSCGYAWVKHSGDALPAATSPSLSSAWSAPAQLSQWPPENSLPPPPPPPSLSTRNYWMLTCSLPQKRGHAASQLLGFHGQTIAYIKRPASFVPCQIRCFVIQGRPHSKRRLKLCVCWLVLARARLF